MYDSVLIPCTNHEESLPTSRASQQLSPRHRVEPPQTFSIQRSRVAKRKRTSHPTKESKEGKKEKSQPLNARETAQHLIVSAQSHPSLCPPILMLCMMLHACSQPTQ
jgi:hypothetical protein